MRILVVAWLLAAFGMASAETIRPLTTGDTVIGVGLVHSQVAGGPVTFTQVGQGFTFRLAIDARGTRTYTRGTDVAPYWVYDRDFSRLVITGMDMPADSRFRLLPPGGELAEGMTWDVQPHKMTLLSCGETELRFKASAEKGPEVTLLIDGREDKVATLRVRYESPVRCEGRSPFLRTHELIFAPALHEIVQSVSINYEGLVVGPMQLGTQIRGWRLTGVLLGK